MTLTPSSADYRDTLRTLSEASVHQHFDAFLDIAWDDPEYAVDPRDERWVLPEADALGRTAWYRSLPREEQVRVGLYRQANVTKVGLQFEQVLVAGLMNFAFTLPNGTPEFRYATHEATEECHHTQMFQEFVNRSGQDVRGGSRFFRTLGPVLPLAAGALAVAVLLTMHWRASRVPVAADDAGPESPSPADDRDGTLVLTG